MSWLEYDSQNTFSDRSPATAVRFQQGVRVGVPDLAITYEDVAHQFTWESVNEPASGHLPILVT